MEFRSLCFAARADPAWPDSREEASMDAFYRCIGSLESPSISGQDGPVGELRLFEAAARFHESYPLLAHEVHLPVGRFRGEALLRQHLRRQALAFAEEAQQQVLAPDVVVPPCLGLL